MSFGLAVDPAGYIYMGDYIFNKLWKIAPNPSAIVLAGDGTQGFADGSGGSNGTAEFNGLSGVAVDVAGNVYIADGSNNRVRRIAPDGSTTTLAGNGTAGSDDGTGGADGSAEFRDQGGVAVDGAGNVYVADTWNYRIRRIAPSGTTSTVDTFGAMFQSEGVVVDDGGHLHRRLPGGRILKAVPGEGTTVLAGTNVRGDVDGPPGVAEFDEPDAISIDGAGNLYVTDAAWDRVRMITPDGTTSTVAGNGAAGFQDGTGGRDGSAEFSYLGALAVNRDWRHDLRVGCRLSAADLHSVRAQQACLGPSRRGLVRSVRRLVGVVWFLLAVGTAFACSPPPCSEAGASCGIGGCCAYLACVQGVCCAQAASFCEPVDGGSTCCGTSIPGSGQLTCTNAYSQVLNGPDPSLTCCVPDRQPCREDFECCEGTCYGSQTGKAGVCAD